MDINNLAHNFKGHLGTVNSHRLMVLKHCIKAGIPVRGLLHDLSKYTPTEFIPGVIYYQGDRSPNEKEREVYGYSKAWMHHKGRNRHHFEYWTDYSTNTKRLEPVPMPDIFIFEMFCDRVAASKIYNKGHFTNDMPLAYYKRVKQQRMIHPETAHKLEMLLTMFRDKGEEYTFRFIRHRVNTYR